MASSTSTGPPIGSIILASADPDRLRRFYETLLDTTADENGFLTLGHVGVQIVARDDIAAAPAEPFRILLNLHVADVAALAPRVVELGGRIVLEPELRNGIWFCTALDPDGLAFQLLQLTADYHRSQGRGVLAAGKAAARLPASDLGRARRWYAEVLDLHPVEERPGGLRYVCADGEFAVFQSTGAASGEHTQMGFTVADIDAAVAELRRRGVVFESYDAPGLHTVDGIADVDGNYPSARSTGERAAWFRDSEGNLLGIGEPVHP